LISAGLSAEVREERTRSKVLFLSFFRLSVLSTHYSVLERGAGPCATESCEPRQVRKEATVSRRLCVPQVHLAPFSNEVRSDT
jgi:hypothetical protein